MSVRSFRSWSHYNKRFVRRLSPFDDIAWSIGNNKKKKRVARIFFVSFFARHPQRHESHNASHKNRKRNGVLHSAAIQLHQPLYPIRLNFVESDAKLHKRDNILEAKKRRKKGQCAHLAGCRLMFFFFYSLRSSVCVLQPWYLLLPPLISLLLLLSKNRYFPHERRDPDETMGAAVY
jgi:hypothetical protein